MNIKINTGINILLNEKKDEIIEYWINGATKQEVLKKYGHFGIVIIENETLKILKKPLIIEMNKKSESVEWVGILIIFIFCILFFG